MSYSPASSSKSRAEMSKRVPMGLLKMAKSLHDESKDKNFVFSPSSIQLSLSLLANGSRGQTMKELLTFLEVKDFHHLNVWASKGVGSLTGEQPNLSFVSGVWVDKSFTLNPTFKITAEDTYKSKAQVVDFENEASKIITEVNKWAEEATNGLIKSILPEDLDPQTRFILANALYFKGTWSQKFDELHTKEYKFYLPNGNAANVPFMTSRRDQFIATFDDFKVLRLPYEKNINGKADISMYIILPTNRNGVWPLVKRMGSEPLFLARYVSPHGEKVEVGQFRLPKFKMTYEFEASEILENLGLISAFSNKAEFHEMVHEGGLKVSKVFHKSCIEINEEGTEAAAVTIMTGVKFCSAPDIDEFVDFVADHPFVFLVRDDENGMVLFTGHVMNPLS